MLSIKSTFTAAASGSSGFSVFWLLALAIAILDDADRREENRRDKREPAVWPRSPRP